MTGSARGQDQLRLILRKTFTELFPLGEVLVFQAHTKIADGTLNDEVTRGFLEKHLKAFSDHLKAKAA